MEITEVFYPQSRTQVVDKSNRAGVGKVGGSVEGDKKVMTKIAIKSIAA